MAKPAKQTKWLFKQNVSGDQEAGTAPGATFLPKRERFFNFPLVVSI